MNFLTSIRRFFSQQWSIRTLWSPEAWFFLLWLSAFLFLCILVMNVLIFATVVRGGGSEVVSASSSPASTFSQSSLNAVQSIFASRAAEETSYTTGVYTFTDPSQ